MATMGSIAAGKAGITIQWIQYSISNFNQFRPCWCAVGIALWPIQRLAIIALSPSPIVIFVVVVIILMIWNEGHHTYMMVGHHLQSISTWAVAWKRTIYTRLPFGRTRINSVRRTWIVCQEYALKCLYRKTSNKLHPRMSRPLLEWVCDSYSKVKSSFVENARHLVLITNTMISTSRVVTLHNLFTISCKKNPKFSSFLSGWTNNPPGGLLEVLR